MAGDGRRGRRSFDLRTWLAGVDPGLTRLRLAAIAVTAMIARRSWWSPRLRALLDPSEPVTVLLFTGVLAMISNLAVNEPTLPRRRATTALLMACPRRRAPWPGRSSSPYPIASAVSFVVVMVVAVWVRRYGPRGFALGMAAFMPFFFTQFLKVTPAQVPWLLDRGGRRASSSTLLLRGVVFAERPARTLRRMVTAFRARAHALVGEIDDVLVELPREGPDEGDLESVRRARARLQEVALLVEDALEQTTAGPRLAGPRRRHARAAGRGRRARPGAALGGRCGASRCRPPTARPSPGPDRRRGAAHRRAATCAPRWGPARDQATILEAAADARAAVAGLVADTRAGGERVQRTAFAVRRVADAIHHAQLDAPSPASAPGRRTRGPGRRAAPRRRTRSPTGRSRGARSTCPSAAPPRTTCGPRRSRRAPRAGSPSRPARPCRSGWRRRSRSSSASRSRRHAGTGR